MIIEHANGRKTEYFMLPNGFAVMRSGEDRSVRWPLRHIENGTPQGVVFTLAELQALVDDAACIGVTASGTPAVLPPASGTPLDN